MLGKLGERERNTTICYSNLLEGNTNGVHVTIIAKGAEHTHTGVVLAIILGFCVIWGKENLSHTLNCFSTKTKRLYHPIEIILVNTLWHCLEKP